MYMYISMYMTVYVCECVHFTSPTPLSPALRTCRQEPGSCGYIRVWGLGFRVSLQSLHSPDSTLPDASHLSKWQCMGRFEPASL